MAKAGADLETGVLVMCSVNPVVWTDLFLGVLSFPVSAARRSTSSRKILLKKPQVNVRMDLQIEHRRYALILMFLTGLFAFRILAQLIQFWHPVEFLPSYADWHSGALPYVWLVAAQGVILGFCLRIVCGVNNGAIMPSARKGKILLWLGNVYLVIMCVRLIVGVTILPDHYWFGAIVPTIFHVVLASFVIVYGRFHCFMSQTFVSFTQGQTS